MKHLTLVILLALAPASFSAEQSLPSFKCTIDYTGGVTHRHGSPRVANFKVGPDNEFRLVHRSRLSESVQTELDRFHGKAVVTDHSGSIDGYQTTINDYVVRFASKDPAIWYSWNSCKSSGFPEKTGMTYTCSWPEGGPGWVFLMRSKTRRFTAAFRGSWFSQTDDSEYQGDDSSFSFGTCAPFYD